MKMAMTYQLAIAMSEGADYYIARHLPVTATANDSTGTPNRSKRFCTETAPSLTANTNEPRCPATRTAPAKERKAFPTLPGNQFLSARRQDRRELTCVPPERMGESVLRYSMSPSMLTTRFCVWPIQFG